MSADATPTLAAPRESSPYPAGGEVFHGRRVWALGEDGDEGLVVEGHGLRALAAANAHERGLVGNWWRLTESRALHVESRWVVFHESCGCTPEQHDTEHRNEDGGHDYDRCDCAHPGLPPCQETFAWVIERAEEGASGALPVMEMSW